MRKLALRLLMLVTLALLLGGGWLVVRAQQGLSKAHDLAEHGLWTRSRAELERYLWLHPGSDEARLLMAEALIKDERVPSETSVALALEHLEQIGDSSSLASRARTKQAHIQLLLLHQPYRADRQLQAAVELDPQNLDAWYLWWKLHDLTGRSHLAGPAFWRVYELSPPAQRLERLSEWYMSQFYPAAANPHLDRLMGFERLEGQPTGHTEVKRFLRFRHAEPDGPFGYAALARFFQLEGDPLFAVQLLDKAAPQLEDRANEPFFLASLISCLFDLGEFARVEECFGRWPKPHEGYEYWLWKATILDQIGNRSEEAIAVFERALGQWPGPVDWRTQNRLAGCLARAGRPRESAHARQRALETEKIMNEEVHRRIRDLLDQLHDPENIDEIAAFYAQIQCPREAACWTEQAQRVRLLLEQARPTEES